jgi:hypothetical protein
VAAPAVAADPTPLSVTVPLTAGLLVCVVIGVAAWPLAALLHAAASVVAR